MKRVTLVAGLLGLAYLCPPRSASARPTTFATFDRAVAAACRQFTRYDRDEDGSPEILALRRLLAVRGSGAGAVLVLVEDRLSRRVTGRDVADLMPSLRTYAEDLSRQGYHVSVVATALYAGPRHQDGLIVLALRDMVKSIYPQVPDLRSLVLVGNFPNAFIVRQYYWPREDSLVLNAGTPMEKKWQAVRHIRSIAEPVASPADIVLADLDGDWDTAYRLGPERLGGLLAAFPDDPAREVTDAWQYTAERYEDFFLVQDGFWEEQALPGGKRRFRFPGEPNAECTPSDRQQANVLARPEISIGRLNAYHIALEPNPDVRGVNGEGLLDAQGHPQSVEFANEKDVPDTEHLWVHSERLERKLLQEYFARNHTYRLGENSSAWLPASITTEWGSSVPEMKAAVQGWSDTAAPGLDLAGARVSVTDFVAWLMRPALARAIKAHAGSTGFGFDAPAEPSALEKLVGPVWWWHREGKQLVPTLRRQGGWVNFGVLRSLYENHRLSGAPALYFHTGCEAMTPAYYEKEPYNSPRHGLWQIAESLLFYADGLALVGRGKVFYDEPREFWKAMGAGGTFGDAWKHYFAVEGADAELAKDGIGRKRAYFWSTIGDCTLRLPTPLLGQRVAGQP